MKCVRAPNRQRKNFDFTAKRRREIVLHARHVGAAETEDFSRWLIAWLWHSPKAKDPIWSLMEVAKRIGGSITEAQAEAIIEEADAIPEARSADAVADFIGLKYCDRQHLGIGTIGSTDVRKHSPNLYPEPSHGRN